MTASRFRSGSTTRPVSVDPAKLAEFAALAKRLSEERLFATAAICAIRNRVKAGIAVVFPPEWITAGMAEQLTDASAEILAESADHARTFAGYALDVANRLDDSYGSIIRASTQAHAWMQSANVTLQGGNPEAAMLALTRAGDILRDQGALAHDRALVDVVRATTMKSLGRRSEAMSYLEGARQVFADFGDATRIAECERIMNVVRQDARSTN